MQLNFMTVDVFTDRRFGGNPLAVVLNADGITTEQMQSIATEFNLAETTFVLPPKYPPNTAEVRIFTPRAELPFAGHPNIGTAFVLARLGSSYGSVVSDPLVFEEKAGLVKLELIRDGALVIGARLAAPQSLARSDDVSLDVVAAACSIGVSDIDTNHHLPCIASCGIPFVFAELKTRSALATAQPRSEYSLNISKPIRLPASFSTCGIRTVALISKLECLRRSMASRKTRQRAVEMLPLPASGEFAP